MEQKLLFKALEHAITASAKADALIETLSLKDNEEFNLLFKKNVQSIFKEFEAIMPEESFERVMKAVSQLLHH